MLIATYLLGAAFGISIITIIELFVIMINSEEVSNKVINELVVHLIVVVVSLALLLN